MNTSVSLTQHWTPSQVSVHPFILHLVQCVQEPHPLHKQANNIELQSILFPALL